MGSTAENPSDKPSDAGTLKELLQGIEKVTKVLTVISQRVRKWHDARENEEERVDLAELLQDDFRAHYDVYRLHHNALELLSTVGELVFSVRYENREAVARDLREYCGDLWAMTNALQDRAEELFERTPEEYEDQKESYWAYDSAKGPFEQASPLAYVDGIEGTLNSLRSFLAMLAAAKGGDGQVSAPITNCYYSTCDGTVVVENRTERQRELRTILAGVIKLRRTFIRGAIAAGPFEHMQYATDQWLEYCPYDSFPKGEGTRLEILFDCDQVACKIKKGSELDGYAYWHCPIRTLRHYQRMLFETWSYSEGRYLGNPEETARAYWIIIGWWADRLERIARRLEDSYATSVKTPEGKAALEDVIPMARNGKAKWSAGHVQWDYFAEIDNKIRQLRLRIASLRPSEEATTDLGYVFRCKGAIWEIVYEGHETTLKDSKGVKYIHHLMKNANEAIKCLDIEKAFSGKPDRDIKRVTKDEATDEGIDGGSDNLPQFDRFEVEDLEKARDAARLKAEQSADPTRKMECAEQAQALDAHLKKNVNIRGEGRPVGELEKARQRVQKAVNTAKRKIRAQNQHIGEHFASAVKATERTAYVYGPDREITWVFE